MNENDWKLNRAQAKFMAAWLSGKYTIHSLMGGWGVGKTRLIAYLVQASHQISPGSNGFVCTDSMNRGARTIALEMSKILEPIGWEFKFANKGAPAPHWLSPPLYGKRTRVWVLSWKRPSTKHESANSLEGPDCAWGLIDECNTFTDSEVARAALGRIRSGTPPRLACLGKPCMDAWWLRMSAERNGHSQISKSHENKHNIKGFDDWIRALSHREYRENVLCDPLPPEGAVLDMFSPEVYPKGNLAPEGWEPDPKKGLRTWVTFDFGVRSPHALVISHDESIGENGADIIWMEAAPDRASVFELCDMLRKGRPDLELPGIWPAYRNDGPPDSIPVHSATGDRSGRNMRDDANMTSAVDDVLASPQAGGLGLRVNFTDDPAKVNVIAGIKILWRRILNNSGERRLLVHPRLWNAGKESNGRSLAKSVHGYKWRGGAKEIIDKDGVHDHAIDALRYFIINMRWPRDTKAEAARRAFMTQQNETRNTPAIKKDRSLDR